MFPLTPQACGNPLFKLSSKLNLHNKLNLWILFHRGFRTHTGSLLRMSKTPGPFQRWAASSSSLQIPTTCTKLTGPKGVVVVVNCGSPAISMCCIRDSLLSSALCQDTWSPAHSVLPEIRIYKVTLRHLELNKVKCVPSYQNTQVRVLFCLQLWSTVIWKLNLFQTLYPF